LQTITNEFEVTFDGSTNTASLTGNYINAQVFGRYFTTSGVPDGGEFVISDNKTLCSEPAITETANGCAVVWVNKGVRYASQIVSLQQTENSCDIYARIIDRNRQSVKGPFRINSTIYGDQYLPSIAAGNDSIFIGWTSLGQDGSGEGVYGRFYDLLGNSLSEEQAVNQLVDNHQRAVSVVSNGRSSFLALWSGYLNETVGVELFGQNYVTAPVAPAAPSLPTVYAAGIQSLVVSWSSELHENLLGYMVYVDGTNSTPVFTSTNYLVVSNLAPGSVHSIHLAYQLTDYNISQLAGPVTAQTWGGDAQGAYGWSDGLPDNWQQLYWGGNSTLWPLPNVDSDGDGIPNYLEYISGTNPLDKNSCLKIKTETTGQGLKVSWNVAPGQQYQLQKSTNLNGVNSWQNVGNVRFAVSTSDWVMEVQQAGPVFYRVLLMR
jgi:hypothetical protein